jgi:hypothetical protein
MDLEDFVSVSKKCKKGEYYDMKKKICKRKDIDNRGAGGGWFLIFFVLILVFIGFIIYFIFVQNFIYVLIFILLIILIITIGIRGKNG